MKDVILQKIHELPISVLREITALHELPGSYLNLECTLPNRKKARVLEDDRTYYAAQVEVPGNPRCYGVAADETQIAVFTYGCNGADAELVLWMRL